MMTTRGIRVAACALGALVAVEHAARAGHFTYGCVGATPDGKQRIAFNSERLILFSAQLVADALQSLTDDTIASYTASDGNTVEGDQEWNSGKETLKLVFKSSKPGKETQAPVVPNQCPKGRGPREATHITSQNVYEVVLPGTKRAVQLRLDCYQYVVSTCG
jgi:hypothetical protein